MMGNSSHALKTDYDVVVVGGGMVGSAAALALVQLGLSVALIEPQSPPSNSSSLEAIPNQRVSAIQRSTETLFKQLGVWTYLQSCQPTPFVDMRISDWQGFALTLSAQAIWQQNLGYLIENDTMTWAIWQALAERSGWQHYAARLATAPQQRQQHWQLHLDDGHKFSAKLVVAADGAKSFVRESLGMTQSQHDYQQSCIVATVSTEMPHQACCWQHYRTSATPFALLPLRQPHQVSIAWYLPPEEADFYLTQSPEVQAQAMTQASGGMLGRLYPLNALQAFPLIRRQSRQYVRTGLLLVGDAAHTVHPQAGQGVNLGFLDVIALSDVLKEAIAHQQPIDDMRVLKRYERRRQADAFVVQRGMDMVSHLFSDQPIMQQVRQGIQPVSRHPIAQALVALPTLFGRQVR